MSDEFGQADGMEKARSHATGECVALHCEHRQASPERIARCGVRIVGQGVEKEIAKTVPREMRAKAAPRREYQPVSIDPARLGLLTKVGLHANIRIKEPQHTAGDGV